MDGRRFSVSGIDTSLGSTSITTVLLIHRRKNVCATGIAHHLYGISKHGIRLDTGVNIAKSVYVTRHQFSRSRRFRRVAINIARPR